MACDFTCQLIMNHDRQEWELDLNSEVLCRWGWWRSPASTDQNRVSVPRAPTTGYGGRKTKEEGEEDRVRRGFMSR